ncbi:lytic transglycosylase domain-containing protein [Streptacidiphilus rugosus]|uniref:lytic transglycosylase domain-containing protein n=1 Tax=Streptacidiphilus rugosus TaxID=405783 RepID=UPI000AD9A796|nr:lytic transglycosylase [Streptacidiphilus rugosus]
MRHRVRPSFLPRLNERLAAVRLNKRLAAGVGAALLVSGAATGTAVALTGNDSHSATQASAVASTQAAARAATDAANRSEQRAALNAKAAADAKAKADAAAKAKAAAAAKAKAQAQAAAAAKAKAAAAAKAKAQADAAAHAKAAQAKAQAQAAAQAKAQAQAAAKAEAQAQAQAAAKAEAQARAAAAAKANAAAAAAAATPTYSNDLSGWIAQAQAVLAAHGDHVPPAAAIEARAMTESSGNPSAVNNWDSNAVAGTPSKGLMQVIDPTFATYALPGHMDIMNPVDNIIAAVRYANATYGAFENIAYGKSGY